MISSKQILSTQLSYSISKRMMSSSCRIGLVQLTCTSDKLRNRETCQRLLSKAKDYGATCAFLPEGFDFIGESAKQTAELAEPLDQPNGTIAFYQKLAVELGLTLSLGGFHEKRSDSEKLSNSHVLISSSGKIQAVYRKMHLFDVEIPDRGLRLKESDYVLAGKEIVKPVKLFEDFKLGLSICYDLRFPEVGLALRRQGANILTFPSAFTVTTGAAGHWFSLLKARAIETQSYVIAAAQTGTHNRKRSSFGHSCVIDPWGTVIAECPEGENVAVAELDMTRIEQVRQNMPTESHRRHDIYGLSVKNEFSVGDVDLDTTQFNFGQFQNSGRCIIFQSRKSFVLVNKKPVVPGHLLAIPKRNSALRLSDLTPDEIQDLFMTVQEAQKLTESFHSATSSTVSIQDGPDAGQTVTHVHVHVLPRKPGDFARNDDIYDELQTHDKGDDVKWRSEDEMAAESALLRAHYEKLFMN